MDRLPQFNDLRSRFRARAAALGGGLPSFFHDDLAAMKESAAKTRKIQGAFNVGDKLPADLELVTPAGDKLSLNEIRKTKPVILVVFRGNWCPFCHLEIDFYVEATEMLRGLGAEIIALSPLPDAATVEYAQSKNAKFHMVGGESALKFMERFGLGYSPEAAFVESLKTVLGADLPQVYGTSQVTLAIPATYVINTEGEVAYGMLSEDVTERHALDEIAGAVIRTQRKRK